jgi:hypothetical protein
MKSRINTRLVVVTIIVMLVVIFLSRLLKGQGYNRIIFPVEDRKYFIPNYDSVASWAPGDDGDLVYNDANETTAATNLYYDDVNGWLGIGTSSPQGLLDVNGTIYTADDGNSIDWYNIDLSDYNWADVTWTGHLGGTGLSPIVVDFALTGDADAGNFDLDSLDRLEFFDAGLFIDGGTDGTLLISTDGTLELATADWDISTTGVQTGMGSITSNGTGTFSSIATGNIALAGGVQIGDGSYDVEICSSGSQPSIHAVDYDLLMTADGGDISLGNETLTTTTTITAEQLTSTDDISASGDVLVTGDVTCDELTITESADDWKFHASGVTGALAIQHTEGTHTNACFMKAANEDAYTCYFRFYGEGIPTSLDPYNACSIGYGGTTAGYIMYPHHLNSTDRPLGFYTATLNRLKVDTDGAIYMTYADDDLISANIRDAAWNSGTGQLGYQASTIEVKENIRDINDCSWLYNLRPVMYDMKDGGDTDMVGLIAEEVVGVSSLPTGVISYECKDIMGMVPDLMNPDKMIEGVVDRVITDKPVGVNRSQLIVPLLKELQSMRAELDELKARVAELEK